MTGDTVARWANRVAISYDVVTTVRSEEKGQHILNDHPNVPKEKLSYVVVEDIAKDGAFDEVGFMVMGNSQCTSKLTA